jgi:hypothetical protein
MTVRHALLALPLLLLAACGQGEKTSAAAHDASGPEAGPKGPVRVAVAPYAGGVLKITKDGVGPINGATAFDLATLKVLFPKAKVEQAFLHIGEGPAQPIINVEQDKVPLLEIGKTDEGEIAYVRAAAGEVRGPRDERLLAKWRDLDFTLDHCRAGEGREVNQTICVRPDAPTVSYVFGVPGYSGKGLPSEAVLKAKGQLNELVWRPAEGANVASA